MKENNNRGSMIVLTIIGIATLLVAVIGATFAYFSVTMKGEETTKPAVVETSTMLITFDQKNTIEYTGAIPGRPSLAIENDDPVYGSLVTKPASNKLSFTLTSAMNMVVNAPYNVYLVIDDNDLGRENYENLTEEELKENDFVTDNLVYLMTQTRDVTAAATNNGTPGTVGSQYFPAGKENDLYIKDDIDGDESTPDENVGVIKAGLNVGDKVLLATGDIGSHATVETWTFEIWLRETGEEQNIDQGRKLKAHIEVVPVNQDPITYEPTKVTTTTVAP